MKLYIKDMTDEQLNEWAARVQELEVKKGSMGFLYLIERGKYHCGKTTRQGDRYDPITSGQQAMDLVVAFKIDHEFMSALSKSLWKVDDVCGAYITDKDGEATAAGFGETPNKAIIRAVIASVYGTFVEIEE